MEYSPVHLSARDNSPDEISSLTFDLLITLLVLVLVATFSSAALLILRRRRIAAKQSELPLYNDGSLAAKHSKHRRTPSSRNIPANYHSNTDKHHFDYSEKRGLSTSESMPPNYPLPEIRIHFSEEPDAAEGPNQPHRVVVVRMGDNGISLEPVVEQLPTYQKDASDRFQSLDLERLGGLKEKEQS